MSDDDLVVVEGLEAGTVRRPRRRRTVPEKRRIAELTFEPEWVWAMSSLKFSPVPLIAS
jgi:hypothetical protein